MNFDPRNPMGSLSKKTSKKVDIPRREREVSSGEESGERVLCSPESFVLTCTQHPEWGWREITKYYNQTKLWYYRMMGLKKVQILLREEQQKLESVLNPEVGSSVTERFTSLLYTCVDELEVQVAEGDLDPLVLVEIAALSTKVIGLGDEIRDAQGISLNSVPNSEVPSDKLLEVLKQRGEIDENRLTSIGVSGYDAVELRSSNTNITSNTIEAASWGEEDES